jgi:phosphatidylglycerophosphatase A
VNALAAPIATVCGIGRLPMAPGTFGSLAALPLAFLLHGLGGFWLLAVVTVAGFAIGVWASEVYAKTAGRDDPSEVVIDEVVGQWFALWPLSLGLTLMGADPWLFPWPGWVGGFLLFRFFDIVKPPPVNWAERLPGGMGIMLDDAVAGALAALLVLVAAAISHGWLG